VVSALKLAVAHYGVPERLQQDNGPQFISEEVNGQENKEQGIYQSAYPPRGSGCPPAKTYPMKPSRFIFSYTNMLRLLKLFEAIGNVSFNGLGFSIQPVSASAASKT